MQTFGWLAAAGAAVLVVGSCAALIPGRMRAGLSVQAAGVVLLGVVGGHAALGGQLIGAPFHVGVAPALGIDRLSGFFLTLLALTAIPALVYATGYLADTAAGRAIAALTGGFVAALAGVLTARDVTTFLACWELMTLMPAAAILVYRQDREARDATVAYVGITHLGGAGVWIAVLLLLGRHAAPATGVLVAVQVAALIGFGTKAGLVPLHSWLPRAHPVAPAHLSALMSGLMTKVALYGLIRIVFVLAGPPPRWLGLTLLATGLLSAVGGVLWALSRHQLKQVLAYSTIENVGIVAVALGGSVVLTHAHAPTLARIAFAAALIQIASHAILKTLLFLGAGSIDRAAGTSDLDHLGGLLHTLPRTGPAFLLGAAGIAGLPPLSGFAAEWLLVQSLLHGALRHPTAVAVACAFGAATVAATAALAAWCCVRVAGLALLGAPRTDRAAAAAEPGTAMPLATTALATLAIALAVTPGLLLPTLSRIATSVASTAPGQAGLYAAHPAVSAALRLPGSGVYTPVALVAALVLLTALLARLTRSTVAAREPAWACGQPVSPALRWTSAAFAKPIVILLDAVFRPQRTVEIDSEGPVTLAIRYEEQTRSLVDRTLYEPAIRVSLRGAAFARRLQTGNVRTYAGYLLGLLVLLIVLVGAGAFA